MKRLLFLLWLCTFSLYADAHGNHGEEGAFMVVPPTHPLLVVASSPIIIKPRSQEEMNILNEAFFDRPGFEYPKKQYLERVFSKLTPGTLKNLLKYRFLLMELKEGIYTESEIQTLKSLEKIEKFLEPLHEIER